MMKNNLVSLNLENFLPKLKFFLMDCHFLGTFFEVSIYEYWSKKCALTQPRWQWMLVHIVHIFQIRTQTPNVDVMLPCTFRANRTWHSAIVVGLQNTFVGCAGLWIIISIRWHRWGRIHWHYKICMVQIECIVRRCVTWMRKFGKHAAIVAGRLRLWSCRCTIVEWGRVTTILIGERHFLIRIIIGVHRLIWILRKHIGAPVWLLGRILIHHIRSCTKFQVRQKWKFENDKQIHEINWIPIWTAKKC